MSILDNIIESSTEHSFKQENYGSVLL